MLEKKQSSYFTFTDIEKKVKKRLKDSTDKNCANSNAVFKKHLFVILHYYTNAMNNLQYMKKKGGTDKRKIEKLEKDVKSMYYLFAMTLENLVNEHSSNLKELRNFGRKQE
ncbi:MAG: hypothetical protein E6767_16820 [Dysgonomonas sp.]|nr:hypothetical protein [Dysgonomonas sp.]